MPFSGIKDTTFTIYIDSVKTIDVAGQNLRKVFTSRPKFTKPPYFYLDDYVERVGALKAIGIIGFSLFDGFGNSGGLRCYADDSLTLSFKSGGMSFCEYLLPLKVNNVNGIAKFSISPNPTATAINFQLPNKSSIEHLSLTNMQGQVLQSWVAAPSGNSIDVSNIPNGIYFVNITIDGITSHQKIIIQH
jgi:hypothetical protein